ncbi:SDR family NAD(P)-dependent oxidoreductase [Streptomyces sp. NE06-03E]|uniref:SDR family NAD(P)-dependent oxidoreductase n=3 Tax=Streptomyces TaxID=1883 RepID=A0AAU1M2S5_9ACTN|nr:MULTISPECIES: SDR family oxidoreductase [unclassified Streptomyces]WSS65792.1 SDR family NAD(P)-dependent oxidoreductase [Streptomyces sp. NBC_01177]WSS79823.1 SDR family NAD(P)-dependent oxidoreductase [Streptomyces sp. NBC_01174]MDX3056800.1 SDR family NAD(P)-dependent oxidoreductase [Streptomyces sp. NE06-03E]MDX3323322.1 SDR family NAD(P)-dependent oxidoreductase [Streptomyces sp. ME02-6979-3A]MDX3432149.1 SDR family NAD(P)-dependent oxidoreductase [Streptomyces sp. ME01-18a]
MSSSLEGHVALVTGAGSGIGRATARALAEAGASVAVAGRRVGRLEELRDELEAEGRKILVLELDVTDEQAVAAAVRSTTEQLGRLDILVNNAGLMLLGPVENADTTDWTRMMDTNVMGLMYMTHAALPELIRNQGTVVQISSVAARVVGRGSAVYNAAKFAVNGFSEGLRQEVTERGVRVVVIEPGTVETELREHITHAPSKAAITERVAKIRQLQSEDIAAAVLYAVTAPPHATVNEILIRPTDQA